MTLVSLRFAGTTLCSAEGVGDGVTTGNKLLRPVGTTVVWKNEDDIPHTVVSLDGTFRSPALDTEDKFSFTLDKAGQIVRVSSPIRAGT